MGSSQRSRDIGYRNINFYVSNHSAHRVSGVLRKSREQSPWSWKQVHGRTLAIYQAPHDRRLRTAALVWQRDDPRVTVDGATPPLLVFEMDLDPEPGAENTVSLAGFDSLEAARGRCVEWTGETTEVEWDSLSETAQIGLYATIRDPGFAQDA